jgi:hypothetical protein
MGISRTQLGAFLGLIILMVGCSPKLSTINQIKTLSEENGRIKLKIILLDVNPEIDWNKIDSLYNIKY